MFSLSNSDLPRLVYGQATALAFGFGLPAAVAAIVAFGHARYRDGK